MRRWGLSAAVGIMLMSSAGSAGASAALGWHIEPSPNPPGATGFLKSVACGEPSCVNVGYYFTPTLDMATLAERWTGESWVIDPTPNQPEARDSQLISVSCADDECMAIGSWDMSRFSAHMPFAERWDGTSWSLLGTPVPSGTTDSFLIDVSCLSPLDCTAVGWYMESHQVHPLVERWNGSDWSIQPVPDPGGGGTFLMGVACLRDATCTAVGWYAGNSDELSLIEQWDGSAWAIVPSPNPTDGNLVNLRAVGCASPRSCTAVGWYRNFAGIQVPLSESWDGRVWSVVPTPYPSGVTDVYLDDVACASGTACTAVGSYRVSLTLIHSLAEHWSLGAWNIQTLPEPPGGHGVELAGIACAGGRGCTAVGYSSSGNSAASLVESFGP